MTKESLRVLTWNVERKKATSPTGRAGVEKLFSYDPDVMAITEARTSFPERDGHVVACEPIPHRHLEEDERRVILWSRRPWRDVDTVGHPELPVGRYVSGLTDTPIGTVRVVGVCISWHMANVHSGDRNRKPWQDHLRYLEHLPSVLEQFDEPLIIAGDFNQRIPRRARGNRAAAAAMAEAFEAFDIVTSGAIDGLDQPVIDHIALNGDLAPEGVWGWPAVEGGVRMSDHAGVGTDISVRHENEGEDR